jgi:parallel beta-helix repeat protein
MTSRLPSSSLGFLSLASTLVLVAAVGCGDDESTGSGGSDGSGGGATTATTTTGDTTTAGSGGGAVCGGADTSGCDVVVEPTGDDAEALQSVLIDDIQSGNHVCLCPGTFELDREISLTVPDVTIRGVGATRDDVILDFAGQTVDDDGMSVDADGFTIENLTVKNTPGNGIVVRGAEGVTFRDLFVTWDGEPSVENGAYAVYPIQCTTVLIEGCEVFGASDAGIYVGQSSEIIVRNNLVHGCPAGIEIENSSDADVYDNEATDNSAGILVFVLHDLEKKDGMRTKIHNNDVHDNNRENFGEPGTIVASVPDGIGIMALAADVTEIHDNEISGNRSTGILAISYPTVQALVEDAPVDPETDQYLTGLYVHDNTFTDNGTDPAAVFLGLGAPPVPDVVWDGVEEEEGSADLCLSADPPSFIDFAGAANIANSDAHSTDTTPHECEGEELPAQ